MSDIDGVAQSSLATQLYDDLVQSLASNHVSNAYNILSILESLKVKSHPSFGYFYENSAAIAAVSEAGALLQKWRSDLKEGDYIDKFSEVDAGWYNAKILSRTGNIIRVHYLSWSEKFDSDICTDDLTLIPYTARTKEHPSTRKKKLIPKTSSDIRDSEEDSGDTGDTGDTTVELSMTSLDDSPRSRARLIAEEREIEKEQQRNKLKESELELETLTRGSRSKRASLASSLALRESVSIKQESSGSSSMDISTGVLEEGDSDIGTDITGEGKTISTISSISRAIKLESESEGLQVEKIPKLLNGREYGAGIVRIDDVYNTAQSCVW